MRLYDEDKPYPMPGFRWEEVKCWRVFFAIFPESFRLLQRLIANQSFWNSDQYRTALMLISTLARGEDGTMAMRANDLLRKAGEVLTSSEVSTYAEYGPVRQYLFTRAEAEGGRQLRRCLDFLQRYKTQEQDWELRLHRQYYKNNDAITIRAMRSKLERPKPRDEHTGAITTAILERAERLVTKRK